jgi:hypothetical protein
MDPFTGHWVANLSKSRRHANHQFERATMTFEVTGETVSFTYEGTNAAGKHESSGMVLHPDGLEHPVSPEAPGVMILSEWVGTHRIDTQARKDGNLLGRGSYEVSGDATVLTATVSGVDASGSSFEQVIVFDRR